MGFSFRNGGSTKIEIDQNYFVASTLNNTRNPRRICRLIRRFSKLCKNRKDLLRELQDWLNSRRTVPHQVIGTEALLVFPPKNCLPFSSSSLVHWWWRLKFPLFFLTPLLITFFPQHKHLFLNKHNLTVRRIGAEEDLRIFLGLLTLARPKVSIS